MRGFAAAAAFVIWTVAAPATVIHVEPDGSGDVPTIAEALAVAEAGDIISLGDGVFFERDLPLKSLVSITSASGDPELTAIDAGLKGRCLNGPTVTGAPTITGITLQNGTHPEEGGLVFTGHNNIRFEDCVFRLGSASRGGAVALTGSSQGHAPQFFDCRFEQNEATSDGGAIWSNGIGYVVDCEFVENTAQGHGGAVYCEKTIGWGIWLRSCRFDRNEAGGDGGAVYSSGPSFPYGTWITGGEFTANSALHGGAARLEGFDFAGSAQFIENEAMSDGGALYLVSTHLDKEFDWFGWNLLAANRAGSRGGGIFLTGSNPALYLYYSTLCANEAPSGAHVWSEVSGTWGELHRSILAFGFPGAAVAGNGTFAASCSDVHANLGGDYTGPLAGQGGTNGNFSEDPLFCDRFAHDYTLHEGSPCYNPLPEGCGNGSIGVFGIGCGPVSSVPDPDDGAIRGTTWGRIKATFR